MHGFYDDKSKASLTNPKTVTLADENTHTVLELTKIGCIVFFYFYTTQIVGTRSQPIGKIPNGFRPKESVVVPCAEYTKQWHAGTGTFRIVGGYYGYVSQNGDPQDRNANGFYVTEE